MRKLTPEEKEQLQTIIDRQNEERKKKRRRYLNHKVMVRTASFYQDADQRLGKLEKKYEKSQRRAMKHSAIRRMELTEKEKEELKAKILESRR